MASWRLLRDCPQRSLIAFLTPVERGRKFDGESLTGPQDAVRVLLNGFRKLVGIARPGFDDDVIVATLSARI